MECVELTSGPTPGLAAVTTPAKNNPVIVIARSFAARVP